MPRVHGYLCPLRSSRQAGNPHSNRRGRRRGCRRSDCQIPRRAGSHPRRIFRIIYFSRRQIPRLCKCMLCLFYCRYQQVTQDRHEKARRPTQVCVIFYALKPIPPPSALPLAYVLIRSVLFLAIHDRLTCVHHAMVEVGGTCLSWGMSRCRQPQVVQGPRHGHIAHLRDHWLLRLSSLS